MSRGGWRGAGLACLCAGALACGDSEPPTSPQPTPAPGRWQGAQAIDGSAPTNPSCNGANAPTAGMDASGRTLATWLSDCVIAVASSAQGQPWSAPSPLGALPAGAPANWLWEPALAVNRGGGAVVAWATQESPAEGRQIVSRRLDPETGWTAAERIDAGESGRLGLPYAPSLALDETGNGLAVWDSEGVVAARLFAARGWLAPERVAGSPSCPRVGSAAPGPRRGWRRAPPSGPAPPGWR